MIQSLVIRHFSSLLIIGYTSLSSFITGGLTSARKMCLDLHHRNTEDQHFPHNCLSSNFFQRWMLARHAAPKIQGSMMLVVINNRKEAVWLNESKYPWNDLMCPLSCFARGELDHPSSLTLAPADARFQSGSESVSWGERVLHQQIGVLLWHI